MSASAVNRECAENFSWGKAQALSPTTFAASFEDRGNGTPDTGGLVTVRSRLYNLRLRRVSRLLNNLGMLFAGEVHVGEVLLCGG